MQRKMLLTLFLTIFLDMLGVGILIPVMPVLLADPRSPHYLLSSGTPSQEGFILLGILVALYSIGQFIAAPVIGQLSDKFGRKKLLAFSILGTACGHALFAIAILWKAVPLLFFARFFSGITGGNIVVAQAAIADLSRPESRAKNFGMIGAAFGLGFIVGPFLGGKLADPGLVSWFDASTPFWFAASLSLANMFFVMRMLKETNTHMRREHRVDWGRSIRNILHAFNLKKLRPIFITVFLMQTGFSFYMTFFSVFLFARFGYTESSIGNYFAYVGLWIVFTQAVVIRALSGRFTESQVLSRSIIAVGLFMMAFFLSERSAWLYFIVPFFSMAVGVSQVYLTGLLSRSAPPDVQGEILGLNGSVNALALSIPPLLSGLIAARFDAATPLIFSSIIIILSGLYFIAHDRRTGAPAHLV